MKICSSQSACPCGRHDSKSRLLRYADCCGRFLETDGIAPDAESLMRSRYSAFVLEREAYLRATWHGSTRPMHVPFDADVKWLGLEVRRHHPVDEHHAEVEFVARHKPADGSAVRLHEESRFVCESGCWYYVDGNFS